MLFVTNFSLFPAVRQFRKSLTRKPSGTIIRKYSKSRDKETEVSNLALWAMIKTSSLELPLGSLAPDFRLLEPKTNTYISLLELNMQHGQGVLVVFMCNHCPFVRHISEQLVQLGIYLKSQKIAMVGISSNDPSQFPEDSVECIKERAETLYTTFPYVFDETQQVAKAYGAVCTPEFFLFDGNLSLYYHGQLDDSRPNSTVPRTGKDLRNAVDRMIQGKTPPFPQTPSVGCSIKWKRDT
ncbi:hypothetical protein GpartN1_g1253.t1 [Galdieria partita]|uniref:Thioredoxin domain-containing protein n=1 Tax=Galdieria partita TaxID=83374 RepID=A0A9C7PTJ4_9RHOD|nr:hypothetical protein GpartN1_g1253.t1 [Galdieria partita]